MPEQKAREYFNNEWITEKEKELRKTSRKKRTRRQTNVLSVHSSTCWKWLLKRSKVKFQMEEVHALAKLMLLERRKKAVETQWVSPSQAASPTIALWRHGRWQRGGLLHDTLDGAQSTQLFIQSETKVSETTKRANKNISVQERKNNSLFHSHSTVKRKVPCRQESLNKVSVEFTIRVYYVSCV